MRLHERGCVSMSAYVSMSVGVCVRVCVGVVEEYVFTCLSPLAHDSVGSLARQGQFCVRSIFNLFAPLNRDTRLLTRRRASRWPALGESFTRSVKRSSVWLTRRNKEF